MEETRKNWWQRKNKSQKISFIIAQVILLLSILALFGLTFCRQIFGDNVGDLVLGKDVDNGFVLIKRLFAYSGNKILVSFVTVFVTIILTFVFNFIVRLCTKGGKKAQTIGSLIRSLIKYVAVLIALTIILATWGVDISSIIAGLGVLTLIIGLGCQVLIQDVISGLFMVFDDYFDVGDMVIIDGFRGYVSQIGLRSIKIDDRLGNIKSINNSSITSCVNLSREDNTVAIEAEADYDEDPRRVEAVLLKELPKLKEKIPQCIVPPTYIGISNLGDSGIFYKIYATCKAPYRFQLERDMQRELYLIFLNNNINVPYNCITVYQPNEEKTVKASEQEKKISEDHEKALRAPEKVSKRKKNIFQHVKEAYDEALEETKKEAQANKDD
ncbi:MAG TPA: hypothetical protein DD384_06825 [Firmicutes bacterium]|nr:hypothetical protein [Bacillota bacterium]